MAVNFEYYKIFWTVVQCGTISGGAKQLHLTQPTVSEAIKKLEDELGCTLLVRNHRGVSLTEEGKIVYRRARTGCEDLFQAEYDLKNYLEGKTGNLTIGLSEIVFEDMLFDDILDYHAGHANVHLQIRTDNNLSIFSDVEKDLVDCGISICDDYLLKQYGDALATESLLDFHYVMVAGNVFQNLKNKTRRLSDLTDYPLIGFSSDTPSGQILRWFFRNHNVPYTPDIELSSASLVLDSVVNGLGIGILPESFAAPEIVRGNAFLISLREKLPEAQIAVITNRSHPQEPNVINLLDFLRAKKNR